MSVRNDSIHGYTDANANSTFSRFTTGSKTAGIIVSICMIILGVLAVVWPVTTGGVIAYVAAIGFVIYGIYEIVLYAQTESGHRDGWVLASGIIFALLGVLLLFSGPLVALETFVFILAFLAMLGGIMEIASYSSLKQAGMEGAGWVLASGIINLILGVMLLILPFAATWMVAFLIGLYLIMGGIALFAWVMSGHAGRRD